MGDIAVNVAQLDGQGTACRTIGDVTLPPGASALANGATPNGGLASHAAVSICQDVWNVVFTGLGTTLTGVGEKLRATASTVGGTDQDAAAPYRQVEGSTPVSVPGHGGRYYA